MLAFLSLLSFLRVSRIYWSTKEPTKRCRYYCTLEEKPKSEQQKAKTCHDDKVLMDEQLHHVISHEEKEVQSVKNSRSAREKVIDLKCSESLEELPVPCNNVQQRIAPAPVNLLPVCVSSLTGVVVRNLNYLAGKPSVAQMGNYRSANYVPQRTNHVHIAPKPPSPFSSPRKIAAHVEQLSRHIPSMMNATYNNSTLTELLDSHKRHPNCVSDKSPKSKRPRKSSATDIASQTDRHLSYGMEVMIEGELGSPEKNHLPVKPVLNKTNDTTEHCETDDLRVKFILTNDEGLKIEADSCEGEFSFFNIPFLGRG